MKETMTEKKMKTVSANCPACSHDRANKTERAQVYVCAKCEALFGTCYLGDSYSMVLPYFTKDSSADARARYFDFTTLGSAGIGRRHGWFDPETKLVTQVG